MLVFPMLLGEDVAKEKVKARVVAKVKVVPRENLLAKGPGQASDLSSGYTFREKIKCDKKG